MNVNLEIVILLHSHYFNFALLFVKVNLLYLFRFDVVGYGCMTCIGNSGPLPDPVADAIEKVCKI